MVSSLLPAHTWSPRRPADSPRLRAAVVLTVGLPLLALAGGVGRLAWSPAAPENTPAATPAVGAPQVWIASLVLPDPPALDRMATEASSPAQRITASLPPDAVAAPRHGGIEEQVATPGPLIQTPAGASAGGDAPRSFAAAPAIILSPAEAPPAPRARLFDGAEQPVLARTRLPDPAPQAISTAPVDATPVVNGPAMQIQTAAIPATGSPTSLPRPPTLSSPSLVALGPEGPLLPTPRAAGLLAVALPPRGDGLAATASLAVPSGTAPGLPLASPTPVPLSAGLARSPLPPVRPVRVAELARTASTPPEATSLAATAPPGDAGNTQADPVTAALAPLLTPRPSARPAAVARLAATTPATAPQSAAAATTGANPTAPQLAALDLPALTDQAEGCGPALSRAIPRRPSGAEGGRSAIARLASIGGTARDAAILRALEGGNIPDHLRALVPVTLSGTDAGGRRTRITLCVMPDYLAVGSDRDFVRVPMGLPAANRVAERFDMILPTARMVDAIHAQAQLRLAPAPMTPGAQMASTDYLMRHNATVEDQRSRRNAPLGVLVSGHKKDLVLTNRLSRVAGRVAIYGWHQANGQPIQPLSTVHGQHYADYSHGIRLISRTAWVNGRAVDLRDLLADGRYAGLLTGEGPIATRTLLAALR
jgi:hypothetical protein